MSQALPPWLTQPLLLNADNFTPLSRTPWGGLMIGEHYKKALVPGAAGQRIGESWEVSCDPTFPSRVPAAQSDLLSVVERWPEAVLSPALVQKNGRACEIVVKLLDAAEPLSLQVHPADDDPNLKPGECGKPESWLVLAAAPGAGLYLGFSRPIRREKLREALLAGDSAKELLHFVPVKPGDYFEIQPGVPHAIGGGVTLLEPQRVLQGKVGKTYRLWDWGRLYDSAGNLDPVHGKGRDLHIEASLPLLDPERQVGAAFVDQLRRQPRLRTLAGGVSVREFPANPYYKTLLCGLPANSELSLSMDGGYAALVMLSGQVRIGDQWLPTGQPALLPHAALPALCRAPEASELALIIPASALLGF